MTSGTGRAAADGEPGALSHRSAARHGEVRLPAAIAVVAAAVSHAVLPNSLLILPRWVVPVIEIALLVPLVLVNPQRLTRETRTSRITGVVLAGVVIVTNLFSLAFLLRQLTSSHLTDGRALLLAALQVWLTNMIAFALVFWELDRGGAVARLESSDSPRRRADFLFPQDGLDPSSSNVSIALAVREWIPLFTDYLYISITNSTAFSPTDTLPLTTRAKALMSVQAMIALVTSLLVIARAVNVLN